MCVPVFLGREGGREERREEALAGQQKVDIDRDVVCIAITSPAMFCLFASFSLAAVAAWQVFSLHWKGMPVLWCGKNGKAAKQACVNTYSATKACHGHCQEGAISQTPTQVAGRA